MPAEVFLEHRVGAAADVFGADARQLRLAKRHGEAAHTVWGGVPTTYLLPSQFGTLYQAAGWAAEHGDLAAWAASRAAAHTQVAIIERRVVGFTDLDDDGYVDMLFVDPNFGRQGSRPRCWLQPSPSPDSAGRLP